MKKKIYIVLLCMMMILSLVGCSKSQKSNDANSNTNILDTSYDEILKSAKGTTVNFYGYGGTAGAGRKITGVYLQGGCADGTVLSGRRYGCDRGSRSDDLADFSGSF